MKSLTVKSIFTIAFLSIVLLTGCAAEKGIETAGKKGVDTATETSGGGRDTATLSCGDVLSKTFVDSLGIPDSEYYAEESSVPCVFADVTFVFWADDQFDTLIQGAQQMLPDPENIKETTSVGSRTMEYDGSYLGHTAEVGFVTKNKNATGLVTFTGDSATLSLAKKIATEMEKNLR